MNMEEKVKNETVTEPKNKEEATARKNFVKELFKKVRAKFNSLPEAERKKHKDIAVVSAMVLAFILVMLGMFYPKGDAEQKPTDGFNIELPDADKEGISGDKMKIYEQDAMNKRKEERDHSVKDLGDVLQQEQSNKSKEEVSDNEFDLSVKEQTRPTNGNRPSTIQNSADAYKDLNTTLGNFYEPTPLTKKAQEEELNERIIRLEQELADERAKNSSSDEMALMEKSYELAAKYMGGQTGKAETPTVTVEPKPISQSSGKKPKAAPVKRVNEQVVSALGQPMSDEELTAACSRRRNYGFHTAVGRNTVSDKNTLSACIYGSQTVTDGQTVRMRLLEPMAVDERVIPKGGTLVGTAKIQGERLEIEITSLEHDGMIIPVELAVYDTDGQPGIFIPNSMELNAMKEIAADMGGNLGSSINISTNAGAQLASDLGRSAIQGTSQYIAKKMRTVKVHLKNGYRVMLYQEKDWQQFYQSTKSKK